MLQPCFSFPQNPNPQFLSQPNFPTPLLHLNSISSVCGSCSPPTLLPLPTPRRPIPLPISCTPVRNSGAPRRYRSRPVIRWKEIYNMVWLLENPESGVSSVLNQCENGGKTFQKSELFIFIRNLRKFRRYGLALEVFGWMSNRPERFNLISTSDMAIKLDLVAKVRGIQYAEDLFTAIPDYQKDRRVYGALLNAYVEANDKERGESLMEKMRKEGCASYPLSFNRMMSMYMNLKEYSKIESLISEMKRVNVRLDLYSYNIWLYARGSQDSVEGLEEVFEEMEQDRNVVPHWSTFSAMATLYIKLEQLEKAKDCMKRLEKEIDGQDRSPYHYLLNLYGRVGEKEEVYRVWNKYKSQFEVMTNWGYHSVIHSLVQVGDIEGAEKLYKEWFSVKAAYDARVSNILFGWYVKEGHFEKAESFFSHIEKAGGKILASTWEILAGFRIKQSRTSDALTSFQQAKSTGYWKPNPVKVSAFLELCEREGDDASKEGMVELLREMGFSKALPSEHLGDDSGSANYQPQEGYTSDSDDGVSWSRNKDSELLLSVL